VRMFGFGAWLALYCCITFERCTCNGFVGVSERQCQMVKTRERNNGFSSEWVDIGPNGI